MTTGMLHMVKYCTNNGAYAMAFKACSDGGPLSSVYKYGPEDAAKLPLFADVSKGELSALAETVSC